MLEDILNKSVPDLEVRENSNKTFRMLASKTADFFNGFIDILIKSKDISQQQELIEELISSLPVPMQKLYKKGVESFLRQVKKNHENLEQTKGKEKELLMIGLIKSILIQANNYSDANLKITFNKMMTDQQHFEYSELVPGIPMLKINNEFLQLLSGNVEDFGMFCSTPVISFIVSGADDVSDKISKHELSHCIFYFLTKDNYLREANDIEKNNFQWFCEEIVGYILSKDFKKRDFVKKYVFGDSSNLNGVFLQLDDQESLKKVNDILKAIFMFMMSGHRLNIKMDNFIYPCLISRNFDELLDNCGRIVPQAETKKMIEEIETKKIDLDKLIDDFCQD